MKLLGKNETIDFGKSYLAYSPDVTSERSNGGSIRKCVLFRSQLETAKDLHKNEHTFFFSIRVYYYANKARNAINYPYDYPYDSYWSIVNKLRFSVYELDDEEELNHIVIGEL